MSWHTEVARAVAFLVSRGMPAGAADLVRGAVLAEVAQLEHALGVAWEAEDAAPKLAADASDDAVRVYLRERALARNERMFALWDAPEGELAPMDAALIRRLRELGADKAANDEEKHALSPAARMPTGAAPIHWRTSHKGGWFFAPAGESWPPSVAEHAMVPLVGLAEGERPSGWRVESVEDSAAPPMPAEIEARLAKLANAAEADSGGDWKALVERYRAAVRATDWGDAWNAPRRLVVLARALWESGGLKGKWEEQQRKRPALPKVVTREALEILSPSRQSSFPEEDGSLVIDSAQGRIVATVDASAVAALGGMAKACERLDLLERVWFQRLVLTLIDRGQTAYVQGIPDARVVVFEGGWSGLASACGYSESTFDLLKAACVLGQGIQLHHAQGSHGGLWTWESRRGSRLGGAGAVSFTLSTVLMPHYVFELAEGRSARELSAVKRDNRKLVPMLVEQALPYRLADVQPNHWGRVLICAQWGLPLWLRDNVDPQDGTMPLSVANVEAMAKRSKLGAHHGASIMRLWAEGDKEAPPLLEMLPGGRVRLTDEHEAAREFARLGRAAEESGRKAGRKSAERRRAR